MSVEGPERFTGGCASFRVRLSGRSGWSPPLFPGRLASGILLPLGPTRLKRTPLTGPT
jgi:hypothetical protein